MANLVVGYYLTSIPLPIGILIPQILEKATGQDGLQPADELKSPEGGGFLHGLSGQVP